MASVRGTKQPNVLSSDLLDAVDTGNSFKLESLIKQGIQLFDTIYKYRNQPIHIAAMRGHVTCLALLMQADIDLDTIVHSEAGPVVVKSVLYEATRAGQYHVVQYLLAAVPNLNVNVWVKDSGSPLHAACQNGDLETSKLLLEAGAQVNFPNMSPFECKNIHPPTVLAIRARNVNLLKLLISAGVDIHTGNEHALRTACSKGDIESLKLLLEAGCDPNCRNPCDSNRSPIFTTVLNGHYECVNELIKYGADPCMMEQPNKGVPCSPLWCSIYPIVYPKVFHCLIEANCDIDVVCCEKGSDMSSSKTVFEKIMLDYAPFGLHLDLALTLIRAGCDWSSVSWLKDGAIPEHYDIYEDPENFTMILDMVELIRPPPELTELAKLAFRQYCGSGKDFHDILLHIDAPQIVKDFISCKIPRLRFDIAV